jgi:polar amino acid transport system permease protein
MISSLPIRPRRSVLTWPLAIILVALLLLVLANFLENPNLRLDVIGEYMFSKIILSGVLVTLELTAITLIVAIFGALVVALMRMSGNKVLAAFATAYIWFFRSTPIIVQLLFWGFIGAFLPVFRVGIPFTDLTVFSVDIQGAMSPLIAAFVGLTLNEVAQLAEIIRGGLISVDKGQTFAAKSIGLAPGTTLRRIILPQALRSILPPMGNAAILLLKTTSLVSVIGGMDLLTRAQNVYQQTFQILPLLTVATIWYLALISVLSIGQDLLERHYGKGSR